MLSHFKNWLDQHFSQPETHEAIELELATAVLFYQIIRADDHCANVEEDQFKRSLQQRHQELTALKLDTLMERARKQAEEAVDFQQFTRVINEQCNREQILGDLWELAYADQQLDPDEEHIIRKICDLLYLSHTQFIQSKLRVSEQKNMSS